MRRTLRVALGIPYRGEPGSHRERHVDVVGQRLSRMARWTQITLVDANPELPFNRGASRNAIVRHAQRVAADVVVICDADSIPEPEPLYAAILDAYDDGRMHFPYDRYRYLSELGTKQYLDGDLPVERCEADMAGPGSQGGCIVVRPEVWAAAGWSPEFTAYGLEDTIFCVQMRTLVGDVVYHPGLLTHLYHPIDPTRWTPEYAQQLAECRRYEAADRDPEAIRKLIAER